MIGKIKKGKSFAGLTKYVLEKEEAELICTNLAGDTPQDFYQQLSATKQLNPRVRSPVSHISISFPPTEKPDKEQLQEIIEETLTGMGFEKNLYFAASHSDRNHFHLHIAASRINIDGECISDWYDKRRLEKVLRNLESQFNLTPVPCSWEVDTTAPSTGQKRRMIREKREFELGLRDTEAEKSAVEKIQDAIENVIKPGITRV
jgi:Relaxase/Mobilisation nuclease domain